MTNQVAPHVQRMQAELYDLEAKARSLDYFINSLEHKEVFESLSQDKQGLMRVQLSVMKTYIEVLSQRIQLG